MMHIPGGARKGPMQRPKTAATTTKYDESRIKDKLLALERLEHQLNDNIESVADEIDLLTMAREAKTFVENGGQDKRVRLSKVMVLENSMCDELSQIKTLLLREKNIFQFEDDKKSGFEL
jgi:hypothetical protein